MENAEQLVVTLPTKELTVGEVTEEVEKIPQKENAGSLIWLKMAAARATNKVPDTELEELKDWNRRFIPGKLRAPLALSQRLNISG